MYVPTLASPFIQHLHPPIFIAFFMLHCYLSSATVLLLCDNTFIPAALHYCISGENGGTMSYSSVPAHSHSILIGIMLLVKLFK
jgi:hypothetical protein